MVRKGLPAPNPGKLPGRPPSALGSLARNGATSEVVLSTSAEVLRELLIDKYPWITELDAVAIEQYCRLEARARLLNDLVNEKFETGEVSAALILAATQADKAALQAAEALGLSPKGRMAIAKDASFAAQIQQDQLKSLVELGRERRRGTANE